MRDQLNMCLEDLRESIKQGVSLDKILSIFVIDDERSQKYFFSPDKKHSDIQVVDKNKV